MTLKPYIVTARRQGHDPIRIPVLAFDAAMAISTVQELYPLHLISTALLAPEWEDNPA
jgi:hypothetical protein